MAAIARETLSVSGDWTKWRPGHVAREITLRSSSMVWFVQGYDDGKMRWIIEGGHLTECRSRMKEVGALRLSQKDWATIGKRALAVEDAVTLVKVLTIIQEFFDIPKKYQPFLQQSALFGNYCHVENPKPMEQLVYVQGKMEEGVPVLSDKESLVLVSPALQVKAWEQGESIRLRITCYLSTNHPFSQELRACVKEELACNVFHDEWTYTTLYPNSTESRMEKWQLWLTLGMYFEMPEMPDLFERLRREALLSTHE